MRQGDIATVVVDMENRLIEVGVTFFSSYILVKQSQLAAEDNVMTERD